MQIQEMDQGDLILSWTWQERQELLAQIEAVKQQMEQSFKKIFGEEGPSSAAPSWKIDRSNQ